MAQPVHLYICYAPEDQAAALRLEKSLTPMISTGKGRIWHKEKIMPGDARAELIETNLKQAQIIFILVSNNLFAPEYYQGSEMSLALQRREKEQIRVIPIIIGHCDWRPTPLGKLVPLPTDGTPAERNDKIWAHITVEIHKTVTYMMAEWDASQQEGEQASEKPTSSQKSPSKKSPDKRTGKRSRPNRQLLSGAAMPAPSPSTTRSRHAPVTRPPFPPSPSMPAPVVPVPPDPVLPSGAEPRPNTNAAEVATPTYGQKFTDALDGLFRTPARVLIWEPSVSSNDLVINARLSLHHDLLEKQYDSTLGSTLHVPSELSLQDCEIDQADQSEEVVLLVEGDAHPLDEMQDFCRDYDENLFNKAYFFYPDIAKTDPKDKKIDRILHIGYKLHYYEESEISSCQVHEMVIEWLENRRLARYRRLRSQRRSGR